MKHYLLAAAAAFSFAGDVGAQEKQFTPAPVPRLGPQHIDPAFRAGGPVGGHPGTPFSGQPTTLLPGPGQDTPATSSRGYQPSAPAPSLSR